MKEGPVNAVGSSHPWIFRRSLRGQIRTHQNLNSASLRMNGRNSSSFAVGSDGPSVSSSKFKAGSNFGDKKAMSRFKK